MDWQEHFVAGRVRRRRLRKPLLEGWLVDADPATSPKRVELSLLKADEDGLALTVPGRVDAMPLGREASELIAALDHADLLVGWPSTLVVVRSHGAVLYAEGDVLRFGEFALDRTHRIRRGPTTLPAAAGSDDAVELVLVEGEHTRSARLGSGERVVIGPYSAVALPGLAPNPAARTSGRPGGYLRIRRAKEAAVEPLSADSPHPLDMARAEQVVALARGQDLLSVDEALGAEPQVFDQLLDRYEGPHQQLRHAARELETAHPTLTRAGETVIVHAAHLFRGDKGHAFLGAASVTLSPTGALKVERGDAKEMPGRMRRLRKDGEGSPSG